MEQSWNPQTGYQDCGPGLQSGCADHTVWLRVLDAVSSSQQSSISSTYVVWGIRWHPEHNGSRAVRDKWHRIDSNGGTVSMDTLFAWTIVGFQSKSSMDSWPTVNELVAGSTSAIQGHSEDLWYSAGWSGISCVGQNYLACKVQDGCRAVRVDSDRSNQGEINDNSAGP